MRRRTKRLHPRRTETYHNQRSDSDIDINEMEKVDLIKKLQERKDNKKINFILLDKIIKEFHLRNISISKEEFFEIVCQIQFDINRDTWRAKETMHRLNSVLKNISRKGINNYCVYHFSSDTQGEHHG